MKSTLPMAGLLVAAVCVCSCKKNSSPTADNGTIQKQKLLLQTIQVFMSKTLMTDYTYDSQNRLISMKAGSLTGEPTVTTYSYAADNRLSSTSATTTSAGIVYNTVSTYTYDDNRSITHLNVKYYKSNTVYQEANTDYLFVGSKISEVHSDNGIVVKSTYDANGNVIKTEDNNGRTTISTYLDNKNLALRYIIPGINSTPGPNLISRTISTSTQRTDTTTYTYTFDARGYVTSVFMRLSADTISNIKTNYAYDMDGYVTAQSNIYVNAPTANQKFTFVYK